MARLILITDSAYAVDCLTIHRNTWQEGVIADGKDPVLTDVKGSVPKKRTIYLSPSSRYYVPSTALKYSFNMSKGPITQKQITWLQLRFRRY